MQVQIVDKSNIWNKLLVVTAHKRRPIRSSFEEEYP